MAAYKAYVLAITAVFWVQLSSREPAFNMEII